MARKTSPANFSASPAASPTANPNGSTGGRILSFIERLERLLEEIAELREDVKAVKAEAKGEGFDVKTVMALIKLRAMTADERAERDALLDLYKAAIGMLDGTPLGQAAINRIMNPPKPPVADSGAGGVGAPDQDGSAASGGADAPPETELPETEPPEPPVSRADIDEARRRGAADAKADVKILANPYVAGDPRRAAWDEGWCREIGSDGMDVPAALRPSKKPPKPPQGGAGDGL